MKNSAICTIITKNYLAHARALSESIRKYHPDLTIYVLLADQIDQNYFNPEDEPFKWIYLGDLSEQNQIKQMSFYYTPFEFCCAVRGLLHEYFYQKTELKQWLFLDSDIMVVNSLDSLFKQLETYDILLTPHARTHLNEEQYIDPHEISFLHCGCYNAGFLGLKRSENTANFINWFKQRLVNFCFNDRLKGNSRSLYVDQLWFNLVPLYFKKVGIVEDQGANLGHWNLFEKTLTIDEDNKVFVNGEPLLFAHFSGWDINNLSKVSIHNPMYENKYYPIWEQLGTEYKALLLKNGYETTINYPYSFAKFNTGEKITEYHRQSYYNYLQQHQNEDSLFSPFNSLEIFVSQLGLESENEKTKESTQELESLRQQLYLAEQTIQAMKSSKFWTLRQTWFKLKRAFGFNTNQELID
jgi:hypothetical protein